MQVHLTNYSDSRLDSLHCTVHDLKYVPVTSIIDWWLWEPDWAFTRAPNSDVADSLDGAYLGPFM